MSTSSYHATIEIARRHSLGVIHHPKLLSCMMMTLTRAILSYRTSFHLFNLLLHKFFGHPLAISPYGSEIPWFATGNIFINSGCL